MEDKELGHNVIAKLEELTQQYLNSVKELTGYDIEGRISEAIRELKRSIRSEVYSEKKRLSLEDTQNRETSGVWEWLVEYSKEAYLDVCELLEGDTDKAHALRVWIVGKEGVAGYHADEMREGLLEEFNDSPHLSFDNVNWQEIVNKLEET